jgi:energy-coupling factor transport system substrate-specific component
MYKIEEGGFGVKQGVIYNVVQILSNAVAWVVVAPIGDILIYAEPANKVFAQGVVSFLLDSAVCLVLGTIIIMAYSSTRIKARSLRAEN